MASKRPPNRIDTTPSGIEIAYWDDVGIDGQPQQRRYRVPGEDGDRLPSISTVAGIYEKWGLMPAAVKLQEEGVIELAKRGFDIAAMDRTELHAALVDRGLDFDKVWEMARRRGDVAHEHLLHLIRDGKVARLSDYDEDIAPWIAAGMKWALDVEPEPIACEYIVASVEHGFAGRPDLFATLHDDRTARVEFKTVSEWKCRKDKNGDPTDKLYPPYDENLIQLAGQEIASIESGYDASDCRLVVRLGPDGGYDITESHATDAAFLAALTAYNEKRSLTKPKVAA